MKKLLLALIALCSVPAWGQAAFTICNSTSSGGGGSTSQSCGPVNVSPSHNWFYVLTYPSSAVTATLSDSSNKFAFHTYTSTTFTDGSLTRTVLVGCADGNSSLTGNDTLVVNYSGNATYAQFEGAYQTDTTFTSCATALNSAGTGAGVGSANGSNTGTFTITSSAATSTVAGVTVIGACDGNTSSTNYSHGTGFTSWVGSPVPQLLGEDKTGASAGSQTATCNFTANANWGIVMALVCDGDCTVAGKGFPAVY